MVTIHVVLLILALVCFGLATINVVPPRGNLGWAGLFLLTLAMLVNK